MMIQQVQRVTLSGAEQTISFPNPCGRFLVKNFSTGDIYVSFGTPVDQATAIRIASGMGQVCLISEQGGFAQPKTRNIYITGTGEVEVQELWA